MTSHLLPKFADPPVIETVLGVQFERLPKLTVGHLGAFWRLLGDEWRNVTQAPALEPQFERFTGRSDWVLPRLALKLVNELDIRLQIRNRDSNRMIQLQNGRMHYNWLAHGGESYPSYEKVSPEFFATWQRFQSFISDESLGVLRPNQWEITYVNRIPKGNLWNSPGDWNRVFPALLAAPPPDRLVRLEGVSGEWHFEIVPQRGRLHASLSHGASQPGHAEVLALNLTARGPVADEAEHGDNLVEGLRIGHEAIVATFKELSSEEAHREWRLADD